MAEFQPIVGEQRIHANPAERLTLHKREAA